MTDQPVILQSPTTMEYGHAPRILTLTTVDITLDKLLLPLLKALRDRGFFLECGCADGPHAEGLRAKGFAVHPICFKRRVLTLSHIVSLFQVYRLIRERRFDVVHVHTPFAQVIGRIGAKIARIPILIYTSHGFQFHESRSRMASWAIIAIERWLGRWTDLIFIQSREDVETAIKVRIAPHSRIRWIGNGIQLENYYPGNRDCLVRRELGFQPENRVVGFIGRIVREKGIIELIEAMSIVVAAAPLARLVIVGDTLESDDDTSTKQKVRDAIRTYGLDKRVYFTGLRNDVPRLLRAMDIFVLPSWREGMPRSVIEAMATSIPVVATNIRGCREEVVDGVTGLLVPTREPKRLAQAILELVLDPAKAEAMGVRGRERALLFFDENSVVQRQLEAYDELIEMKGLRT